MKIVYIANSAIPSRSANSVHVMKMCEAFKKNGISITLIVPNVVNEQLSTDDYKFYGIKNKFTIIKNKLVNRNPIGIWNYIFSFTSVIQVMRLKTDLTFTRNPVVAVFCILFRQNCMLELHGKLLGLSLKLFDNFNLFESKYLKKLIVISNPLKEIYIHDYKVIENKILVLPDGVTYENFEDINYKEPLKNNIFNIGYVGSLYKGRGIDILIEMATNLPKHNFNIYGGEDDQIELLKKELINKNIININIFGHIPNSEVPQILCNQDILLMPYQKKVQVRGSEDTAKWMSPMKMFEYMASGRVILSSNMPVLKEILNNNNSFLLNPEDINEWINCIKYIEKNKDNARTISNRSKFDAQKYTWKKRALEIEDIIKNG